MHTQLHTTHTYAHTTSRPTPLGRAKSLALLGVGILAATMLAGCISPPVATGTGPGGSGGGTDVTAPGDANDDTEGTDETGALNTWTTQSGCIVGEWLVDNKNIGAFFASNIPGAELIIDAPTGDATVNYAAGGSYTVNYDNWSMTARQDGMVVTLTREGTDRGEYTATDAGTLTQNDTDVTSVVTLETPAGGFSIDGEPLSATAQYTCDASTLAVTIDGDTSVLHRQ